MVQFSKGAVGKAATGLPLLALASAAWIVTLAGLAIARHSGEQFVLQTCCSCAIPNLSRRAAALQFLT